MSTFSPIPMPDYLEAGTVAVVFEGDMTDLRNKADEYDRILGHIKKSSLPIVRPKLEVPNATEIKKAFGNVVVPIGVNITTKSVNDALKAATGRSTFNGNINVTPVASPASLKSLTTQIQRHLESQSFSINVGSNGGATGRNGVRMLDIPGYDIMTRGGMIARPGGPNQRFHADFQKTYAQNFSTPGTTMGAQPRYSGMPTPSQAFDARKAGESLARDLMRDATTAFRTGFANEVKGNPTIRQNRTAVENTARYDAYRRDLASQAAYRAMVANPDPSQYRNLLNVSGAMNRRGMAATFGGGPDPGGSGSISALRTRLYDPSARIDHAMSQLRGHFNTKVIPTIAGIGPRLSDMMTDGVDRMMAQGRRNLFAGLTLSTAFTAPAIGGGKAALGMTTDYERRMRLLPAQTDIAEGDLPGVSRNTLRISRATGKNYEELTDALRLIASSGNDASETLKILEASAIAAAGGMGLTGDVGTTVATALQVYGEDADQATRYTDIMAMAIKDGRGEAESFAPAIGKVVGMAKLAGVSFEEVAANIATFTRAGVTANQAGTALNMMLKNLSAPTRKAKSIMEAMGMTSEDVRRMIDTKGLFATLQKIFKDSGGNIEVVQGLIGSVTGLRNALSTAGAQAEDYQKILHNAFNASGRSAKSFEIMGQSLDVQWSRLRESVSATIIEITQKYLPALTGKVKEFADDAPGMVDSVKAHWEELPEPIRNFVQGLGAFLVLGGPLLMMKSVLIDVAAAGMSMAGAFAGSPILVGGAAIAGVAALTGQFDDLRENIWLVVAAMAALSSVKMSPAMLSMASGGVAAARSGASLLGNAGVVAGSVLAGRQSLARLATTPIGQVAYGPQTAWVAAGSAARIGAGVASGAGLMAAGTLGYLGYQNYKENVAQRQLLDQNIEANNRTGVGIMGRAKTYALGDDSALKALDALDSKAQSAGDDIAQLQSTLKAITDTRHQIALETDMDQAAKAAVIDEVDKLQKNIEDRQFMVKLRLDEDSKSWMHKTEDFLNSIGKSYLGEGYEADLGFGSNTMYGRTKDVVGQTEAGAILGDLIALGGGVAKAAGYVGLGAGPLPAPQPVAPSAPVRYPTDRFTAPRADSTPVPVDQLGIPQVRSRLSELGEGPLSPENKAERAQLLARLAKWQKDHPASTTRDATGGGIDPDALARQRKAQDEAQRRAEAEQIKGLQEIQKAWQNYTSALEGTLGRIRAFGEETEEARIRNEMMKVSLGAVSEEYIKQAVAVGKLYDQMQRLTGMRDSMRSVFDAYQSKLVGMGILSDPNQKSVNALQNVFQYSQRMERKSNRAMGMGGGAVDYATGQIKSLEGQQMDVRYSGDGGGDILSVAQKYLGMRGNDPRAASLLGSAYGEEWCAGFVRGVMKESGRTNWSKSNRVMDVRSWAEKQGLAYRGTPQVGDVFTVSRGKGKGHTGFVTGVKGGRFTSIAGNEGSQSNFGSSVKNNNSYDVNSAVFIKTGGAPSARAAGPAPKAVVSNELRKVYGNVKPDYDGSMGFLGKAPDWLREAWGRPVSHRDTFAEQRMAGQATVFSRQGIKNITEYAEDAGLEAAIKLVKSFRDGVSKQDITLRSKAMEGLRIDANSDYRREDFMLDNRNNQYADLDWQLRRNEIDLPTWTVQAGNRSRLRNKNSWIDLSNTRASAYRSQDAMQAGLNALGYGSSYSPENADRAKARREYELDLWRNENSKVRQEFEDKRKDKKTREAEANRMAQAALKTWDMNYDAAETERIEKVVAAEQYAREQMNEQARLNVRLRREGLLTEQEITDELELQAKYAEALRSTNGDRAAANDARSNLKAIQKYRRLGMTLQGEKEDRLANSQARALAYGQHALAYTYDPASADYYRNQRRLELEGEASARFERDRGFNKSGFVKEGLETFDIQARADAASEMSRTLHVLRLEMRTLADDTGLAARALDVFNSKTGAFASEADKAEAVRLMVSNYGRSAVHGINRDTDLYRYTNEGDRADALAQMRIRDMDPVLSGTSYAADQRAIAASTRARESSNAGWDLIQDNAARNRQDTVALRLAVATTVEERKRIENQAELNELKARGVSISRHDLTIVESMHRVSEQNATAMKEQTQYREFGDRLRDDLVGAFEQAGTSIKGILGGIGKSVQELVFGELRVRAANAIVENILPGWVSEDRGSLIKKRPGRKTDTASGQVWDSDAPSALAQMVGGFTGGSPVADLAAQLGVPFLPSSATNPTAPTVPGGLASMVAQNVSINAAMARMQAGVVYLNAGSVVGGPGAGGGMSLGSIMEGLGLGASPGRAEGGMSTHQMIDMLGAENVAI